MRQAGRYLPEYHEVRKDFTFLEICRTPELAVEVSLQPIRRFPMDVAIVFSDILVIPEAMGQQLSFGDGGPRLRPVVGAGADDLTVDQLKNAGPERLRYVGQAIRLLKDRLAEMGEDRAVMGFCGAPLTLAAYMAAGGPPGDLSALKRLMETAPDQAHRLFSKIGKALSGYLRMQVESGADALQVFESSGDQLDSDTYRKFALEPLRALLSSLGDLSVPVILYMNGTAAHLDAIEDLQFSALSADFRVDLKWVRERLGDGVTLQGNLDPDLLNGSDEVIRDEVFRLFDRVGGRGLIFNLGSGVRPTTPVRGVQAFVDAVCELENRK
jgi:uroporphyrinogen decarboxylase